MLEESIPQKQSEKTHVLDVQVIKKHPIGSTEQRGVRELYLCEQICRAKSLMQDLQFIE